MRRFIAVLTFLLFFVWIMPLGAFIKPFQEQLACNGKRAICLCSHLMAKAQEKALAKVTISSAANGTAQNEKSNPGGANHYFLTSLILRSNLLQESAFLIHDALHYTFQFERNIEHVPKA